MDHAFCFPDAGKKKKRSFIWMKVFYFVLAHPNSKFKEFVGLLMIAEYTRKLCYRNLNGNKIGRLGRANQNQRVDLTISPERITRKPKNDKNGFHHKGILKVPHPSGTVPRFGTGCSSVQSCSESAISFSQKQMRDIESIATKLTKELNSMKDVVQESWHSKVYPATPLKYSADEVC